VAFIDRLVEWVRLFLETAKASAAVPLHPQQARNFDSPLELLLVKAIRPHLTTGTELIPQYKVQTRWFGRFLDMAIRRARELTRSQASPLVEVV